LPDPVVPDATLAASSAAADPIAMTAADSLDTMSETQLHAWRMTGDRPTADPKVPASTAGTPPAEPVEQAASTDVAVEATSEVAAAPIKAKTQERIDQVLADRAKERARADRAESRLRDLEARSQPPTDARPAASSAAPAGLVEPNPETFAYGTADPDYVKAVAKYEAAAFMAAERATWAEQQSQARARDDNQRVIRSFEEKAAAARQAHPDFDAVALLAPTDIPPGSAADLWVLEDEAGAEILYHLQQATNAGERKRILALGPREQLKELVRLGDRLTAPPAAARTTNAPPPPPTLATRATPADPVERALAQGTDDEATGAYIAAQNRRDLARLKR
jgi:hypothetical protein